MWFLYDVQSYENINRTATMEPSQHITYQFKKTTKQNAGVQIQLFAWLLL